MARSSGAWGFPRHKIPHSSAARWQTRQGRLQNSVANAISEKAIRFQHLDYNPDRAQKLISSSMSRHLSTRNISSKSMHAFLNNLANRQTDRHGQKHVLPPLSEVMTKQKSIITLSLPRALEISKK